MSTLQRFVEFLGCRQWALAASGDEIVTIERVPLLAGRTLALVGIVLVAINLRTVVAAISPIAALISKDIPLTALALGVLGATPPLAFAIGGVVAPIVSRRLGLEPTVSLATGLMVVGQLVRALSPNFGVLFVSTVVTLLGVGVANVLLPPTVKKYFPDRLGTVTATYATLIAVGSSIPPLLAVPVADAAGWRVSLGVWFALAITAVIPWLGLLARHRMSMREIDYIAPTRVRLPGPLWKSPVAISLALMFSVSTINAYASFAWLPTLLVERSGVTAAVAGSLLALYAVIGVPSAIVVPIYATRAKTISPFIFFAVACFLAADLGFLFIPTAIPWLWVVLAGTGPALFPLCLVLINARTRTQEGAVALSGFTQGIGYVVGASGPLVVGVLHDSGIGWVGALIFLAVTAAAASIATFALGRQRFVEDDLMNRERGRRGE